MKIPFAIGMLLMVMRLSAQQPDFSVKGSFSSLPFDEFVKQVEQQTGVHFFYIDTLKNVIITKGEGIRNYLPEIFATDGNAEINGNKGRNGTLHFTGQSSDTLFYCWKTSRIYDIYTFTVNNLTSGRISRARPMTWMPSPWTFFCRITRRKTIPSIC